MKYGTHSSDHAKAVASTLQLQGVGIISNKKCGASGISDDKQCRLGEVKLAPGNLPSAVLGDWLKMVGQMEGEARDEKGYVTLLSAIRRAKETATSEKQDKILGMLEKHEAKAKSDLAHYQKLGNKKCGAGGISDGKQCKLTVHEWSAIQRTQQGGALFKFANKAAKVPDEAVRKFEDGIASHYDGLKGISKETASGDLQSLYEVMAKVKAGKLKDAMKVAETMDPAVREIIPDAIWVAMGGVLSPTSVNELPKGKNVKKAKGKANAKGKVANTCNGNHTAETEDGEPDEDDQKKKKQAEGDDDLENAIREHSAMMKDISVEQGRDDEKALRNIQSLITAGQLVNARSAARNLDPLLRELIPQSSWLRMRGVSGPLLDGSLSYQDIKNKAAACACAKKDMDGEPDEDDKISDCGGKDKEYKNAVAQARAMANAAGMGECPECGAECKMSTGEETKCSKCDKTSKSADWKLSNK